MERKQPAGRLPCHGTSRDCHGGKRWSDVVDVCNTAIGVFQECGHKLWWASQLIDLGDAYRYRNEPGDLDRARETYQQSLDMYIEMGAPGYLKVLKECLVDL